MDQTPLHPKQAASKCHFLTPKPKGSSEPGAPPAIWIGRRGRGKTSENRQNLYSNKFENRITLPYLSSMHNLQNLVSLKCYNQSHEVPGVSKSIWQPKSGEMKSAGSLVHVLQTIKARQNMRATRNMNLNAVSLLGLMSLTAWTHMVMGGMVATLR